MTEKRKIYLASSWKNIYQPSVLVILRDAGHQVYDFRNPPGRTGFQWNQVDSGYGGEPLDPVIYRELLRHPTCVLGFKSDYDAMLWADTCVLVLPCGRSAHIEAGYFNGADKDLYVLALEPTEPDLMHLMAKRLIVNVVELLQELSHD